MERIDYLHYKRIYEKIHKIWGITFPIWYPLDNCNRNDVIAFNINPCSTSELHLINNLLKGFLVKHAETDIYLLGEINLGIVPYRFNFTEFHLKQNQFNEDMYWCDNKMDWIIYACHDGYLTIGGCKIIQDIKSNWSAWEKYFIE
jgi:hypothetical protein